MIMTKITVSAYEFIEDTIVPQEKSKLEFSNCHIEGFVYMKIGEKTFIVMPEEISCAVDKAQVEGQDG